MYSISFHKKICLLISNNEDKICYICLPILGETWFIPYEEKNLASEIIETFLMYIALFCFVIPISMSVSIGIDALYDKHFTRQKQRHSYLINCK